ncbi:MAG: PAS domain S-box protein [Trueperaceae bacterium]|nr:PAS domain S-box protein [Trueperaceae bacterium]
MGDREGYATARDRDARSLFEDHPLPMWVFDPADLRILDVNRTAQDLYGYDRDTFLTLTLLDLRPQEDRASFAASMQAGRSGSVRREQVRHLTRDGRVLEVEVDGQDTTFDGRPARLVVVQDVSDRRAAERARDREVARVQALLENAHEVATVIDADWRVTYVTPGARRILGYDASAWLGRNRDDLLPEESLRVVHDTLRRLKDRPGASETIRYRHHRADGTELWLENTVTNLLHHPSVEGYVFNWRDVSRDVAADEEEARTRARIESLNRTLSRSVEAYRLLASFGAEIESLHDVDTLLSTGLARLTELLGTDMAGFYEVHDDQVQLARTHGDIPERLQARIFEPQSPDVGLIGEVVTSGRTAFVRGYDDAPHGLPEIRGLGVGTHLAVPVLVDDVVRYVVSLSTLHREVELRDESIQVAESFVRRLENALHRVRYLDEVAATREATFRAFGLALEARDFETGGHTDRVVALAERFARRMGLGDAEVRGVRWGAYLHDVGKVAMPDAILLKPGPLSEREFEVIRTHAVLGWEMIRDVPFLPPSARALVRHHHERWDGAGYPDGLAGEAIPLAARMFALVDVFDALTHARPYKGAWPPERAARHLSASAGRHFDPTLVPVFLDLVGLEG